MTKLSLQAKQDFLEKEASTRDPIKGIAEFVWNARWVQRVSATL
jgi:hypothetical protein